MSATEEKKSVTGLDQTENPKEAEYDLLTSLLEAASYKTADENIVEFELFERLALDNLSSCTESCLHNTACCAEDNSST